ncbi:MAG: hypothetical protein EOP88_11110 [Verrucomicrobiaceae bacterium]|nr:MAG: hypothetical protein EOP88_11110 [Verrucomicrobiaceae bacterium]
MKASIALSLLILAIGAILGLQDQRRLASVRASHDKLVAEAAGSGITVDSANPEDSLRVTKREREDKEAEARDAAAKFIAFAKEMEAIQKKGGPPDAATQKRIMDFLDRILSLDAAQLKILITEVRAAKDIKDETRQSLIGFSIMTLANDHPQAALTLLVESSTDPSGVLKMDGMGKQAMSTSLAKWAKDDPMAALEWVRKNGEKMPALVDDNAKRGMISGAAAQDPKLAFKLIGELGLKDGNRALDSIVDAARTPAERTATLTALREHLATLPEGESRNQAADAAIRSLLQNAVKDGFDSGTRWLEGAGFSKEELGQIGDGGFHNKMRGSDTGRWIEWMGKTLPEGKPDNGIRDLVRNWTENDYQAAGKWLASAPEGRAKELSVRSYAETVSRYEPESAVQWADTLPAGKAKEETLQRIYQNWPRDDDASKAAAEAFKKERGIR